MLKHRRTPGKVRAWAEPLTFESLHSVMSRPPCRLNHHRVLMTDSAGTCNYSYIRRYKEAREWLKRSVRRVLTTSTPFLFVSWLTAAVGSLCVQATGRRSFQSVSPSSWSVRRKQEPEKDERERTRDGTDAKWKHIQPIGGNNRQAFIPEGGTQISIPDRLCKSQQTLKAAGFWLHLCRYTSGLKFPLWINT